MPPSVAVTEPHPKVPKAGAYISGGRGGAGNFKRYPSDDLTAGPSTSGSASRLYLARPFQRPFTVGRGGFGNVYKTPEAEEQMFEFDEEIIARRERTAPVYHIGRGGAANWVDESKPRATRTGSTDSSDTTTSTDSGDPVRRSAFISKLQRKLARATTS